MSRQAVDVVTQQESQLRMLLKENQRGHYYYLQGISPYSSGVVAADGFEIACATLSSPLPWHPGMVEVRRYLESIGRDHFALCGVQLRCPQPHTMAGFLDFNGGYRRLLESWKMMVGEDNPVARTNVSPVVDPPGETVLVGFSYVIPTDEPGKTFVVAGGGELVGELEETRIVRVGEISPEALLEKSRCVVGLMQDRMQGLEVSGDQLSQVEVYTAHPLQHLLEQVVLPGIPAAARLGVRWFYSRPPVVDIEFEMDMRGVRQELLVAV